MVVVFLTLTSVYAYYKADSFALIGFTAAVFIINKVARYKMDHDRKKKALPSDKVDPYSTDINIITFLILVVIFIHSMYRMLTFGVTA
ncbi:hypothetical protein EP073_05300 [Geovibrio thiophilus]|uniref:Uncharacterized protein n=1 Tax=Geovibrio thiophilus TaxID=139438 RepID=A0A3R5Y6H2_9BACT|nr:hypothetical protein [Geovibrio thiophilus]QAR32838.1 hypothetical protein EP073_05300 [Geovibrio thiophilus]